MFDYLALTYTAASAWSVFEYVEVKCDLILCIDD